MPSVETLSSKLRRGEITVFDYMKELFGDESSDDDTNYLPDRPTQNLHQSPLPAFTPPATPDFHLHPEQTLLQTVQEWGEDLPKSNPTQPISSLIPVFIPPRETITIRHRIKASRRTKKKPQKRGKGSRQRAAQRYFKSLDHLIIF